MKTLSFPTSDLSLKPFILLGGSGRVAEAPRGVEWLVGWLLARCQLSESEKQPPVPSSGLTGSGLSERCAITFSGPSSAQGEADDALLRPVSCLSHLPFSSHPPRAEPAPEPSAPGCGEGHRGVRAHQASPCRGHGGQVRSCFPALSRLLAEPLGVEWLSDLWVTKGVVVCSPCCELRFLVKADGWHGEDPP